MGFTLRVVGNRVYWKSVRVCYANPALPRSLSGDCRVAFSHRHGRLLINIAGTVWVGDDDGSMPRPEVVIGSVVGPSGLLPDPAMMQHLIELIQVREDDGLNTLATVEA